MKPSSSRLEISLTRTGKGRSVRACDPTRKPPNNLVRKPLEPEKRNVLKLMQRKNIFFHMLLLELWKGGKKNQVRPNI